MRFERCTNIACRRPFQVNEFDFADRRTGTTGVEEYVCPHCGQVQSGLGNGVVLVHALSEEQEAEFNRTHPLANASAVVTASR